MKGLLRCAAFCAIGVAVGSASPAFAKSPLNISIGFTGTDRARINLVDGTLSDKRPGWFVELAVRVGRECGHSVSFHQKPWKRILNEVAAGRLWAATNSSYKVERTAFGEFPTVDGQPDKSRAFSKYEYIAIVRKGENTEIVRKGIVSGRKYIVERGASIISVLKKGGANIHEMSDYDKMLRLLTKGRADAMAVIACALDDSLERFPDFRDKIERSQVPLLERVGYIMFSKQLYQKHSALIECFWTESAPLMQSTWFQDVKRSYADK
ncbi:MAG: hypothetical protein CMM59_01110 [Rhodospirillaceae bacterium]|nr:hypothetical protein [Rhodospirillaceae bacterium]